MYEQYSLCGAVQACAEQYKLYCLQWFAVMNSYLLPLFVAALALYASTLASRLLRRLRDLRLLSKLPHPPATSFVKGVEIEKKDFHRTLTQFAEHYGGIYSVRFYHEKV